MGDWRLRPTPNHKSTIPNPQSPNISVIIKYLELK